MNYYRKHSAALGAVQGRLADDCPIVHWKGEDRKVIPGTAIRRADLAAGGFQMNADFQFEALVGDFGDDATSVKAALLQTPLGYLGDEYKVVAVNIRAGGLQIGVECNSLNQSA